MANANLTMQKLNILIKSIPVVVLVVTVISGFAVGKNQIDENKIINIKQDEKIEILKVEHVQIIRNEERLKAIQDDVKDIKRMMEARR